MSYTEPQARVVWTGTYTRCLNGRLFKTTSSYSTVLPRTTTEAWDVLAARESWLPWTDEVVEAMPRTIRPRPANLTRGGWTLQEVAARPQLRLVCSRCGDTGCGGPSNPHE